MGEQKPKVAEKEWSNPIEFLMTCIGFSVGLGNVWRFPFLCYKHGGSAFVIAMAILLFVVGLPLFFLEITIAQYSKFGPLEVWKLVPLFQGIGVSALLIAGFISLYYNVIICYSLIFAISSFMPTLPWTDCSNTWNDENCCKPKKELFDLGNNQTINIGFCSKSSQTPAKQYFENYVISLSEGIEDIGGFNTKLVLSLFSCWLLVFLSLSKGVQSLGKFVLFIVSYVTAIFPYIMIIALIIRGVTLEGAMKGIEYYILKINTEKLLDLQTWIDAASQVYFILGIAQGGLFTLGKHNKFNYNHQRSSIFIAVLDGITGIMAGFAIFSVLGYMSVTTGKEIDELAVGGPGLTFIVYPEALALMPAPQVWCVLFFLMMITIGFGSILSLSECVLDSITQAFEKQINTPRKQTILRFCVCMAFFLVGLTMATRSSLYIQNLIDSYLSGYPFLICAFLEALGYGWIYGLKRIKRDIKMMLGSTPNVYWLACFLIVPVATFATIVLQIIANSEVKLNDYSYPDWAHAIGWCIVAIVLFPLPAYFVVHFYKTYSQYKSFELSLYLKPHEDWKPAVPIQEINEKTDLEFDEFTTTQLSNLNQVHPADSSPSHTGFKEDADGVKIEYEIEEF